MTAFDREVQRRKDLIKDAVVYAHHLEPADLVEMFKAFKLNSKAIENPSAVVFFLSEMAHMDMPITLSELKPAYNLARKILDYQEANRDY